MIVWGIDTASNRCSVAVIDSDDRTVIATHTVGPLGSSDLPEQRLADLHTATKALLDDVADDHPPAFVLIEQPRGARGNQDRLLAGWAVITAAAVTVANRHGGIVEWVEIGTWRARSGLFAVAVQAGHKKLDTATWKATAAGVAKRAGYAGKHVDEIDAVCIGLAACNTADLSGTGRRAA